MGSDADTMETKEHVLHQNDFLQIVTFNLAKEEYAIEITKAKEIILVEGVTRVPQMPDFIEGIINLRGNVIPVIDLRKRFGLPVSEQTENSRIVVTRMEAKIVGLIVDSVSQVMKLPKDQIQEPPETIAGLAGEYLIGVGRMEDRLILLLDIDKIISTKEQALMAQGVAPVEAGV